MLDLLHKYIKWVIHHGSLLLSLPLTLCQLLGGDKKHVDKTESVSE